MQKEEKEDLMCPSFSTYSSDNLANVADQVTRDHFISQNDNHFHLNDDHTFEFVALPSSSHHLFFNGYNSPLFPVFNAGGEDADSSTLHLQMRNLFISDDVHRRDSPSSSSSSEVDELDGIPASTYCVWTPKSAQSVQGSPNICKKSNSTGSLAASPSKRWKVLDLLRRSNSDGKNTLMLLKKKEGVKIENSKEQRDCGKGKLAKKKTTSSAVEAVYVEKRERRIKEKNKRRTYLPYKQHLIGYSSSFNSFSPFS